MALAQTKETKRPNIIVILTDDMGYSDIGCYGSEIKTPNIDALAGNGLRFVHFYNTSRCSPSRASLLTGLYPHQAGMGHLATENFPQQGYADDLSKNAVTMAEVFKSAGYSTYMTGKWHISKNTGKGTDQTNWPCQRGFDRYFGTLNGSGSYYDPGTLISNNTFIAPSSKDFYYTNAISDTAVKFIAEHSKNKPFFFYIAYTAAHWPLQAPQKDVNKYAGLYDKGWDYIRQQRFEKQKRLGLIDSNYLLTPRGGNIPAWESEPMKQWQSHRMEVYAAMVDVMDQGIGRILKALKKKGELDNTIIFYMHDNGGCAEPLDTDKPEIIPTADQLKMKYYSKDSILLDKKPIYTRSGNYIRSGKGVPAGEANSFISYGEEWANVSNTPFRLYKHWAHEGGIASPLIISWPEGLKAKGNLSKQSAHLIDIMATCLDLTGATYPKVYNGRDIQPFEGVSLKPVFTGNLLSREVIFWEHEGNRALRFKQWKLVSRTRQNKIFNASDENTWELYDMEKDPSETKNIAAQNPEMVAHLSKLWEQEAIRTKAKPWPWTNSK